MNIRPIQPAFNGFIQTYYDEGHGHLKPITFNTNSINFEPLDTGYYSSDLTKVSSQGKEYKIPCSYSKFTETCKRASQSEANFERLDIQA